MSYSPHPHLPYSAFIQACRAFRPSDLVPAIAQVSAEIGEPPYSKYVTHRLPPWGLAAAARESLLHGNEYRSKTVDRAVLLDLMAKYQIAMDIKNADVGTGDFATKLLTLIAYEQFPYQESTFEELARSHAWLVEGLPYVDTKVIDEAALTAVLDGVPLRDAIGATFFLQVGALMNGGVYSPSWLDQPNFTEVLKVYPRANIETMAARLTTTPRDFKAAFERHAVGSTSAARYDYNPLVATPFVDMGDGVPVAPASRLILRTVSPGGLYYAGVSRYGNAFANDLGLLFEHYVGRQLRLIAGATVEPEIVFGKGGGEKSVDWFVVLPNLVVLVEVKSRRLGPGARAGGAGLMSSLRDSLERPRNQLARTVHHISERHPAFAHVPAGRQMLALVVTAEPFYTGSAYLLDRNIATVPGGALPDVPVAVASARAIEALATHGADAETILLEEIGKKNHGGGVVGLQNLSNKDGVDNPILVNAWNSYPWPTRDGVGRPQST